MLLAVAFFLADIGTDAWFKSGSQWSLMPLAIIESLFIFTLGSEVLFTIATGFVAESFGDFIVVLSMMFRTIMDAFRTSLSIVGIGADDEPRQDRVQGQEKRY